MTDHSTDHSTDQSTDQLASQPLISLRCQLTDPTDGRTDGLTNKGVTAGLETADRSARDTPKIGPVALHKLAEARAVLHTVRANCCSHGVLRRHCTAHPDDQEAP